MPIDPLSQLAEATREAEQGIATCRVCKYTKAPFLEMISVMYGGGMAFAMCMVCAEKGEQILIRRGPMGIEILRASKERLAIATPDMNVLKKRPT